jgi:protein pelota
MKLIAKELSKGIVKVQITNPDDIWFLSQLISPGDYISGKTFRKIKLEGSDDRKTSVIKKPAFIKILAEKIEYSPSLLKVLGPITEGPDDVPRGSYHSFSIEENTIITIEKERWYSYQVQKLHEAAEPKLPKILICVMDREEAYFAISQQYGYTTISSLQGDVEKKEERASTRNTFYLDIIRQLKEYSTRYEAEKILLASPAFWKEDLLKLITDNDLKKKIILVTCSSAQENAINEVLRRPETQQMLKMDRTAKEINLVEELLKEISISGKASYGLEEVKLAADAGAVAHLMITDKFIEQTRLDNVYGEIDKIMKRVDQSQGEITIISALHDGGKRLDGLGGIGALLRYRLSYE